MSKHTLPATGKLLIQSPEEGHDTLYFNDPLRPVMRDIAQAKLDQLVDRKCVIMTRDGPRGDFKKVTNPGDPLLAETMAHEHLVGG